jgi:hypothetical protein
VRSRGWRGTQEGRKTPPYVICHRESETHTLDNTDKRGYRGSSFFLEHHFCRGERGVLRPSAVTQNGRRCTSPFGDWLTRCLLRCLYMGTAVIGYHGGAQDPTEGRKTPRRGARPHGGAQDPTEGRKTPPYGVRSLSDFVGVYGLAPVPTR